jgi:hypothetical protein
MSGKGFGVNTNTKKKHNHTMNYVVLCKHNCAFTPLELYRAIRLTEPKLRMPSLDEIKVGIQQAIDDGSLIEVENGKYEMKEKLSDSERIDTMIGCKMLVKSLMPSFRK